MKPAPFRYERAASLSEAIVLLSELGDEAKILAGGQSLMPLLNFRLARPTALIDINSVEGLSHVMGDNGYLGIGAIARQRQVEIDPEVRERIPLLSAALGHVGHVTIRNRGTFGGSLAHADPAAEIPVASLALDAQIKVDGRGGSRMVDSEDFFLGPFTTVLGPDEILTEVRIPWPSAGTSTAVVESARRHGDFGIVVVMASLHRDGAGRCDSVRLSIGGVEPLPLRLKEAENVLLGSELTADAIAEAAEVAFQAVEPMEDVHAPAAYRGQLTRVFVRRALTEAANQNKDEV